jgi:tRNA(adenine34) deaminase
MRQAIAEAKKAFEKDEVPVGAIIVYDNKVIAKAHNQREMLLDPTAHAEMIAITQASAYLQNWRLSDTTVYVTLEPCTMCAGALVQARAKNLVYGAKDEKQGACESTVNLVNDPRFNHRINAISGVLEDECSLLLKQFFLEKRRDKIDLPAETAGQFAPGRQVVLP